MHKKVILLSVFLLLFGLAMGSFFTTYFQHLPEEPLRQLTHYDHTVEAKFVAVDEHGDGVVSDLVTEVRDGQGLVLVNVNNVLADVTTQYSARLASQVASNYTKIDLSNLDIIYNLKSDARIVAGQSAGSIMAVSTIAALENKPLKKNVIITGSINKEGNVVDAGGLQAKAAAAKKSNAKLFLVPKGSGTVSLNLTRTERCSDYDGRVYCRIDYPASLASIGDDIGIEVVEVETISQAMRFFL